VKKFILALINILENSMKHSGLNQELEIEIMAYTLNSSLCIDVKNNLSEEVYFGLTDDKINSLNNLLSSPDSIELMRAEGGTGLAKASNYLKQAYRGYNLSVSCENHKFITRLLKDEINING
ncbi:TPA: GHKL domain-containing protein, partial [Enterobacter bugandensis]|nr:GHKL domain-containing protein [Enterobacter bugandensis]